MEQALKQRLVGALVITALAAIFVPMFFEDSTDESRREIDQSDLAIPAAPEQNFNEDNPIPQSPTQVLHAYENETVAASATEEQKNNGETVIEEFGGQAAQKTDAQLEQPLAQAEETATPDEQQAPYSPPPAPEPITAEKSRVVTATPKLPPKPPTVKNIAPQLKQPATLSESPANAQGLKRWVVQLGSFSKKDNADVLVTKLRAQGFNAYNDSIQVAGKGTMYRVRIGPELDKKRALAMQKKLQQLNNSNSILLAE